MLDHEIKIVVSNYIQSLTRNTLDMIEWLDIWESRKSRKLNGMFFMEVAPDYTS